jgi:hypothetical protein
MPIDPVGAWISGPLAAFSDGYASELIRMGYAPASVHLQMRVLADLSDCRNRTRLGNGAGRRRCKLDVEATL